MGAAVGGREDGANRPSYLADGLTGWLRASGKRDSTSDHPDETSIGGFSREKGRE